MAVPLKKKKVIISSNKKKGKTKKRKKVASILLALNKPGVFKKRSKQLHRFSGQTHRFFMIKNTESMVKAAQNTHFDPVSIEATRRLLKRHLHKRISKCLFVTVAPSIVFTKKPKSVRMGKGKGEPKVIRAHSRFGKVLFRIKNIYSWFGFALFNCVKKRLPIKVQILSIVQSGLYLRI